MLNIAYFLKRHSVFLTVLIVTGSLLLFFNWEHLFMLPYGIHEWAKSDRYVLALGFFDNGMNFFHPRTLSLRPIDGITGVEFPLQAYLAAIFGKFFGREFISLGFHLLNIGMGSIGIAYLFQWVYEATKSYAYAILGVLPILSSTFYLDYMGNYLPDPFACSLIFISFYYTYRWMKSGGEKLFTIILALLVLATLVKTSSVVFLGAFLMLSFFSSIGNRQDFLRTIVSGIFSGAIILGWFFYSRWLNETYESDLFLARILPITDKDTWNFFFYDRLPNLWMKEFFIQPAYILISLIVIGGILLIDNVKLRWWLVLTGLFSLGLLGLFSGQLIDHEYYFIVLGLAFLMLLYCLCLIEIGQRLSMPYTPVSVLVLFISVAFLFPSYNRLQERRSPDYPGFSEYYKYKWMTGGDMVLTKLSIPEDENILVLDEYAPNLGLMYFGRRGINYPYSKWKTEINVITEILDQKGYKIVVMNTHAGRSDETISTMINEHFFTRYEDDSKLILEYKGGRQ